MPETVIYQRPLSYGGGVHTLGTFRKVHFVQRADSPLNLAKVQFCTRLITPLHLGDVCLETEVGATKQASHRKKCQTGSYQ